MKKQTGRDYKTSLKLVKDKNMTDIQGGDVGGIIVLALERRIVVPNSLADRLQLCFE